MNLLTTAALVLPAALVSLGSARGQSEAPPLIRPGAPGEASTTLSADEAIIVPGDQFTEADVAFMQGMISHHAQALEMTELLETRSESDDMRKLAERITLSQEDEIKMMQEWLQRNGREVTSVEAHHAHDAELMPGMLTPEEMKKLEDASGVEFDRLFLELMIKHHRGALTMVDDLQAQPGGGQASDIFAFTSDIVADQSMEIDRMGGMLSNLSVDPRASLKAGFRDAGEAILNMELVASLPKPEGFYDPNSPAGRPIRPEREEEEAEENEESAETEGEAETKEKKEEPVQGPVVLSFANTDMAFAGGRLFEGNYHGFSPYDVEDPKTPALLASVVCPGGQGDVSVYGNLLFMSVEQTRGRLDCGLEGVLDPVSSERFRGVRIFDIGDVRMPRQVAAVQTCRGSHTHTLVSDPDDEGNIYVYGSGTSSVRSGEELAECSDAAPEADSSTALFSIDVIQVPIAHPEQARIVARPRIFADSESGAIAGLWRGGDHGPGTQKTSETNQCHDITVYPEVGLAAGACSGNGILLDISDPVNPKRLDEAVDPAFAYWHSATFNNDGTKVVFTDEWGGGTQPRCRASDPLTWGANAIFTYQDGQLELASYFKLPVPQTDTENCVAHNGSLIPVPGRDILVQGWYQGGVSVIDFTDAANPVEIAFFDRGPLSDQVLVTGGYWSTYWYNGHIFGADIQRGVDVFRLVPSEHLSPAEIAAAELVRTTQVNVQHQQRVEWPAAVPVARAYLDQMVRARRILDGRAAEVDAVLTRAERRQASAAELRNLATRLDADVEAIRAGTLGGDAERMVKLADVLRRLPV